MAIHSCNQSSYSGGRDQEDLRWRPTLARNKLGMVACACHLSYAGVGGLQSVAGPQGKNTRPYPKNN
jgi:hypothetical protein